MSDIQHIESHTPDLTAENVGKLAALFPDVLTEITDPQTGETKRAIDFDALRDKLGDVAEGTRERYQFTWPGKRAAKAEARKPISKTLRPVKERSKDWDSTQNLYIEGDNLDALKILRETYAGKIKLIYIDPPYNTGHDFIYKDNFGKTVTADKAESGDYDDEGGQLVANPESNGRFHSDWCSMIYSRLLLARDLLSKSGALVISIGYQEVNNLMRICDELFSEKQVMAITLQTSGGKINGSFNVQNEYVVFVLPTDFEVNAVDSDRKEYASPYHGMNLATFNQVQRPNQAYPIYVNDQGCVTGRGLSIKERIDAGLYDGDAQDFIFGSDKNCPSDSSVVWPVTSKGEQCVWRLTPERFMSDWQKGYIKVVPLNSRVSNNRWSVQYLSSGIIQQIESGDLSTYRYSDDESIPTLEIRDYKTAGSSIDTVWTRKDFYTTRGSNEIKDIFQGKYFSYPKPLELIEYILQKVSKDDSLILDFFSGSATCAHAVIKENSRDKGRRQFIMIQFPEKNESVSEAAKAGYSNICEIGEERIRRAGEKIKAEIESENAQGKLDGEVKQVPDIGFRVLRVDSSSYEDVRKTPAEFSQGALDLDEDNTKEGRSSLDLLFECLPTFQLPYTSSIETLSGELFDGYTVYSVNDGQLLACFDEDIPESLIRGMAGFEPKPSYVVVAEKSLPDSAARTNFAEIFKQSANALEGQTQIRII